MAEVPDYMKRVVGWDLTTTQVGEREADLGHLLAHSAQLEGIAEQFKERSSRYKALLATKLELSQEMQELFRQGEALVSFIRTGVRQHYGANSDQLVAFGLVPTSRRARRTTTPPAEAPEVSAPVPDSAK